MAKQWYLGGWYQRWPSDRYPFWVEMWDVYDGVYRHLAESEDRAKELIEERAGLRTPEGQ